MGFTVTRQGGANGAEFQAYLRLLRQRGINLGRLPRVPEPENRGRWLYVWEDATEAQRFAEDLKERTGDDSWQVVETAAPPSEGPLGPVLIQLARRGDGLLFALHPLSRAMIHSAFPHALPSATNTFLATQQWAEFRRSRGGLPELVQQLVPNLTGLTKEQLQEVGYAVVDTETEDTLLYVPPAQVIQG